MLQNNKGSILVSAVMIFSIVTTIAITCIGICYSNMSIFNLEYKNESMKQSCYAGIEIVKSNVLKEVELALKNTANEEEFYNYFRENDFLEKLKDISKSQIKQTTISIQNNINIDQSKKIIQFGIISNNKNQNHSKKVYVDITILNPFKEENLEIQGVNKIVKVNNYKEN